MLGKADRSGIITSSTECKNKDVVLVLIEGAWLNVICF